MMHDASRSIIQTNIQRWASSGSVVTCDPTEFLDIANTTGGKLKVSTGRRYPFGLGINESGFALENGQRVSIPLDSFAVWYGKATEIHSGSNPRNFLVDAMLRELRISPTEQEIIFVYDDLVVSTQPYQLSDEEICSICSDVIDGASVPTAFVQREEFSGYTRRIRSMVSRLNMPTWLRTPPEQDVRDLLDAGTTAVLLYGPPRTGKTRLIDQIIPRDDPQRCTIQIHDGWGYDHLIEGLKPDDKGNWDWRDGPLKSAIEQEKTYIVLEEINRTAFSQALGEVFSLIEDAYRGSENGISLRSGRPFYVPRSTVFFMTMNTVDKSTEDLDDALLGRVAAIEFPPRSEDLLQMLATNGVSEAMRQRISQVFSEILNVYPLGHGYFSGLRGDVTNTDFIVHYKSRIRPVLVNFLGDLKKREIETLDNIVDENFSQT